MADLLLYGNTQTNVNAQPITAGQLLYTTDLTHNKQYLDKDGSTRVEIGGMDLITSLSDFSAQTVSTDKALDSFILKQMTYEFLDVAVATTDFATYTATLTGEADLTTAGYLQKAHIACTGVTSDYLANVVFGAVEADSGNYASVVTTEAGYVNIYAKTVPASAITIPTIDCTYKGV